MGKNLLRLGIGIAVAAVSLTLHTSTAHAASTDCQYTYGGGGGIESIVISDGGGVIDQSYGDGVSYLWVCQEGTLIFAGLA